MVSSQHNQIVLYSDFNCPFCYAMHERLQEYRILDQVEWRGVQHAPYLPIPMGRWNGQLLDELRYEVAMVNRLAPTLPIVTPNGKPNTQPAISLAARVISAKRSEGHDLVRCLYWAFWREGRDISDRKVLEEVLATLGLQSENFLEPDEATPVTLDGWDHQWRRTGEGGVPLLERSDGELLVGFAQDASLRRFLSV
jgi:predicted DsbA family dithiol-disulfide isomerase